MSDNSAETGESFGDAAASLALQQQADGKESKIGHANTIGGMLQCLFHFGADAHFVYQLLKFGADRRPNLTGYQLDCLGRGQTGPDGADDQIERVWECVQELSLVPALRKPQQQRRRAYRGCADKDYGECRAERRCDADQSDRYS